MSLPLLLAACLGAPRTLTWDTAGARLLAPGGTYGRIARLADGALLCSFERGGRAWVQRSVDRAATWSEPVLACELSAAAAANPELCPLSSGAVLLLVNQRPRSAGQPFAVRLSTSRDGGRTWQPRGEPVFAAGTTRATGCWEPAAVQRADGSLHLVLAHEVSGDQEILGLTSRDEGATWSAPTRLSFVPGHRDGMPVPLLLGDGRLVVAIEDNSLAPPHFRPTLVAPGGERWAALATPPPLDCNLAAPYLVRLPAGETLLSVQSNEDDRRWRRLAVYVGDTQARGFGARTLPFGLGAADCLWNSLFVLDERTVLALSGTAREGRRGLWCVAGTLR